MKKNIILIFIVSLLFAACSEDFLELSSEQNPSADGLYSSENGLEFGVIGLYDDIQKFYAEDKFPSKLEQRSDNAQRGERPVQYNEAYYIDEFIIGDASYWRDGYNLIKNSYVLDDYIDKYLGNDLTDSERTNIMALKGEAAFLRAFVYFDLVRYYGSVPKVTETLDASKLELAYELGLSPASEIYNEIVIPDLQFAIENCKTKRTLISEENVGRATSGAASAVLGDVYLTLGDYTTAKEVLQKFYDNKAQLGYKYVPLTDIFFDSESNSESAGENTAESIFEIQWSIEDGTPYYNWLSWDARDISGKGVQQRVCPSPHLIAAYSFERNMVDTSAAIDHGERFSAAMDTTYGRPDAGEGDYYYGVCLKYLEKNVPVERNTSWRNYILYRLSDVTLMLAEATYMSGGGLATAEALINEVRAARGIVTDFNIDFWKQIENPAAAYPNVTGSDQRSEQDAFIYGILHERRLEMAFECKRYFDLKRTGKLLEFIKEKILSGDKNRMESEVEQTLASGQQLLYRIPDDIVKENREDYSQN